ncbi:unnamed protein product [Rotaria socialis]|nr:unnamed protein product [Rotaria socialis]
MSHSCAVLQCERKFRALCDCCKQNLCLQHLTEHNMILVSQLNPLTNEIKALGERLESLKLHDIVRNGHQKLKQWQQDCHEKIDHLFEKKYQELDRLVTEKLDQQRESIRRLHSKLSKLVHEQEATRNDIDMLSTAIRQIEIDLKKIEQTSFQINTRSLVIDDSYIQVRKIDEHERDHSTLASVYRTLASPSGSYVEIASNDQFLLVHQKPNLCIVDLDMNIKQQILWEHKQIWDMCWSSVADRFIVIDEADIFLIDERLIYIETVDTDKRRKWMSCACSQTSLFLSTDEWGSKIMQFRLLPSITFTKEWKPPLVCTENERIDGIACRGDMCALLIMNGKEKSLRIELRTCASFKRIWLRLIDGIFDSNFILRCCSLKADEWLVADCENRCLLHITKDGKLKMTIKYHDIPYRIKLFGPDMIVVSTQKGINFHKI